jgi:hypothetical protein
MQKKKLNYRIRIIHQLEEDHNNCQFNRRKNSKFNHHKQP